MQTVAERIRKSPAYTIEPKDWDMIDSDYGVFYYTDESYRFSIKAERTGSGKLRFLGTSDTFCGDSDFYLDPTRSRQMSTCWGNNIAEYPAGKFIDEDNEFHAPVVLTPEFVIEMAECRERDDDADFLAGEFAEWCRENGGKQFADTVETDEAVREWLAANTNSVPESCAKVAPCEISNFLFGHEYETEAA